MSDTYMTGVLDELKTIAQTTTSVDLKIHKRYTKQDMEDARREIREKLVTANRLYFSLVVKEDELAGTNNALKKGSLSKWIKSGSIEEEFGEAWDDIQELISAVTRAANDNKKTYEKISIHFSELSAASLLPKSIERRETENSCYTELFNRYNDLQYSFQTARDETKNFLGMEKFDENTGIILLCKNVRIMEDLINKICTNNIDKSIIGGEQHFDSIKYGFEWLFCHEDLSGSNTHKQLDIRDRNRYLDYIKYQIMVASKYVKGSYKDSEKIDLFFEKIKSVFDAKEFEDKTKIIAQFKKSSKALISDFFNVYELLINYRDVLFREEEIRKSLHGNIPAVDEEDFITINPFITNLSSIAVRVLLDRFVSFVKINDLNFGNSTFNRAWFNYSELSKSNYAGSNFKYARIENAKMKDCDISTCNLILADGGHTDFSYSNFNFSNLSGINLVDATVNHCEFQNAIFVDANIDNYKKAIDETLGKGPDDEDEELIRARLLSKIWIEDHSDGTPLSFSIQTIIEKYLEISPTSLNLADDSEKSWAVLQYERVRNDPLDKPAKIMREIAKLFLGKHISAQLLQYMQKCFSTQSTMNSAAKNERIKRHGNILLVPANLTSVSAKYTQLGGSDLSHVVMPQSSFENADLSGVVMHYTAAAAASFIFCNINHAECFESDFHFANFSSTVANNALLLNCNLNHTNWNKAIIVGSIFADLSYYVEDILSGGSDKEFLIQTDQNLDFGYTDKLIRDLPTYSNHASSNQNSSLSENVLSYWQNECSINDATFTDALADSVVFLNIVADRSTFNRAFFKNSFWANCRSYLSDCVGTDFRYSAFLFCCMGQSNFTNANLTSTIIRYVDFSNCNLFSTLFNLSKIDHALFISANIRRANFSDSEIQNSAFENCKFDEIILSGAKFSNCIFSHVDFISLIGYHSSEYHNCYFYNCSFENDDIPDGIQNLRERFD